MSERLRLAGLDEPIHLSAHNPEWAGMFAAEAARISRGLPDADLAIEHIGSTSVPGLLAKPIIDVMVGMEAGRDVTAARSGLVALGYEDLGEAGVPGRLYFRRRGEQSFNVALVERGGRHWRANLALRDYLRAHPEAAREYGEVKRAAVESGIRSLLAYSEHKSVFLSSIIRRALSYSMVKGNFAS